MSNADKMLPEQLKISPRLGPNYALWISIAILVIPVTLILVVAFADLNEATSNQLVSLLIFSSLLIFDSYRRFIANLSRIPPITLVDGSQYSTTYIYGDSNVTQQSVNNEQQSLVDAAREIQQLLKEVSSSYPESETIVSSPSKKGTTEDAIVSESSQIASDTTREFENETVREVEIATEVIRKVENDSSLKQRAIAAARQGFLQTLKSSSTGLIIAAAIESWLSDDTKARDS